MIKDIIRPIYRKYKQKREFSKFKEELSKSAEEIKIVVGSSDICPQGWIPTEEHFLNLLKKEEWEPYFKRDSISNILAEHVWEHLTIGNGYLAACTCYTFLKKGGKLRIAVPDGFHPSKEYIDYVKPGGSGAGADDHKVLYTYESLSQLLERAGYHTELLEYFDANGMFHATKWNNNEGYIHRSIEHDKRNIDGKPHYTSLIVDAIK